MVEIVASSYKSLAKVNISSMNKTEGVFLCFITTILTYVRGTAYLRLLRLRRLDSPPLMYTNGKRGQSQATLRFASSITRTAGRKTSCLGKKKKPPLQAVTCLRLVKLLLQRYIRLLTNSAMLGYGCWIDVLFEHQLHKELYELRWRCLYNAD